MEQQLIQVQNKIYEIRGIKVMLDFDLAEMYGVETKSLKRAVRRNIERFEGDDFMFELTEDEYNDLKMRLRCQFGTLEINDGRGKYPKYPPFAFTELGVAMLSSILNSKGAIEINRKIMRAFVILRQYALGYAELNQRLENFMCETNMQFGEIYQALTEFAEQKRLAEEPRKPIGFKMSSFREDE